MFRIGEFSKLTQVSIRMLRYYDEIGLLKPACVDRFTGYRSYTAEQIPTLQKIILLRDLGCSIAEISSTLQHWSKDAFEAQLKTRQQEVELELKKSQEKLSLIRSAYRSLKTTDFESQISFQLKSIPAIHVVSLRKILPDYFHEGELWQELTKLLQGQAIDYLSNQDSFAIYHDAEFKETNVDVEVCVPVSGITASRGSYQFRQVEAVTTMACAMVYGPFENIRSGYLAFASWLTDHAGYRMCGCDRQICHRGPWNETSPEQYLTEIQIPVEIPLDSHTM